MMLAPRLTALATCDYSCKMDAHLVRMLVQRDVEHMPSPTLTDVTYITLGRPCTAHMGHSIHVPTFDPTPTSGASMTHTPTLHMILAMITRARRAPSDDLVAHSHRVYLRKMISWAPSRRSIEEILNVPIQW